MRTVGDVVGLVLTLGVGSWLAAAAVRALRTGTANAAGTPHRRRQSAGLYWLIVLVQLALAAACFGVAWRIAQRLAERVT